MKTRIGILATLCLAFSLPACAHPGHDSASGYLSFWRGVLLKSTASMGVSTASSDFWRTGFISKYRIIGAQVPNLLP